MNSPLIVLSNLSFAYRGIKILKNVNLQIERGTFVGFFGPNGGGKTTLLKLLMGFLTPSSGSLTLFEREPEQSRHRIGYVPQAHRIDPDFPITVTELIALGASQKRSCFGHITKEDREHALHWMEQLGLLVHRDKSYGELSGGLAQRALLARALISDPDLILLDEPTAHIDAHSLALFLNTLEKLKGKKTILLVTHDLKTVREHSDRLFCVQGTVSELQKKEICEHFSIGLYHTPVGVS